MESAHLLLRGVGDAIGELVEGVAHLRGSNVGRCVLEGLCKVDMLVGVHGVDYIHARVGKRLLLRSWLAVKRRCRLGASAESFRDRWSFGTKETPG